MSQRAPRLPGYLKRIADGFAAGLAPRGRLTHVNVIHDPGCKRPNGGPCTCDPDVVFDYGVADQHVQEAQ